MTQFVNHIGFTAEEIAQAIRETNPDVTRRLSSQLRSTNSLSTNLELASAIFTANNLKYVLALSHNFDRPNEPNLIVNVFSSAMK